MFFASNRQTRGYRVGKNYEQAGECKAKSNNSSLSNVENPFGVTTFSGGKPEISRLHTKGVYDIEKGNEDIQVADDTVIFRIENPCMQWEEKEIEEPGDDTSQSIQCRFSC